MTSVPARPNWNFRTHALATGWPSTSAGLNFQRPEACNACRAKYLLGPGENSVALETLPSGSTATRTATFTLPVTVLRALHGMSGILRSATSPAVVPFSACAGDVAVVARDDGTA